MDSKVLNNNMVNKGPNNNMDIKDLNKLQPSNLVNKDMFLKKSKDSDRPLHFCQEVRDLKKFLNLNNQNKKQNNLSKNQKKIADDLIRVS